MIRRSSVIAGLLVVLLVGQPIAPIVATTSAATNTAPEASIDGPENAGLHAPVTFDASGTTDAETDSANLTYSWDFDADGSADATGMTVSHSFSESGTQTVTLTVEDPGGLTDKTTHNISVAPAYDGTDSVAEDVVEKNSFGVLLGIIDRVTGNPVNSIDEYSPQAREAMIYQNVLDENQDRQMFAQVYENYGQDSRRLASQDARYAIGEAWSEGFDQAYAGDQSKEVIRDRFSRMQRQIIEIWEARLAQFDYHRSLVAADDDFKLMTPDDYTGLGPNNDYPDPTGQYYYVPVDQDDAFNWASYPHFYVPVGTTNASVTLANGTSIEYETVEIHEVEYKTGGGSYDGSLAYVDSFKFRPFDGKHKYTYVNDGGPIDAYYEQMNIRPNNQTKFSQRDTLNSEEWGDMFIRLNTTSADLVDQYNNKTIDVVWNGLENGTVDFSNMYSIEKMIAEMSGDDGARNMTDRNLRKALFARLGLNHPDLENTSKMVIDVKGVRQPKSINVTNTVVSKATGVSTTSQTIDVGVNTSNTSRQVWGVFAEYDDGDDVRIPRSEWSLKNDTAIAVTDWTGVSQFDGNLTNVSVHVIESSHGDLEDPYVNETITGTLFADNFPPSGKFEVNTTYHTGAIDGPEQIVTFNGSVVRFEGQFHIEAIYAPDGSERQNVTWDEPEPSVESSDDFVNETKRIQKIVKTIIEAEDRADSGAGGGGGGDSSTSIDFSWPSLSLPSIGGIPGSAALVVVALLAVLLLLAVAL